MNRLPQFPHVPGVEPAAVAGVTLVRLLLVEWTTARPVGCAGIMVRVDDGVSVEPLVSPAERRRLAGGRWWIMLAWYPPPPGGRAWIERRYPRPNTEPPSGAWSPV